MTAYYNEIDPYAAQWLRNLIAENLIVPGEVDERDIRDIKPSELAGYTQCHFFAGIGGWSLALRLAGWPDDKPVWTGSCPCQPFSSAGRGEGVTDERHLWPAWFHLIRECRPAIVFGEQVEAAINHGWLDLVQADMEGEGYAVGRAGIPAAGVGAPHIRQRLWFVADTSGAGLEGRDARTLGNECAPVERGGGAGGLANANGREQSGQPVVRGVECDGEDARWAEGGGEPEPLSAACRMADTAHVGLQGRPRQNGQQDGRSVSEGRVDAAGTREGAAASPLNGFWRNADWVLCRDGKWRPVEPGTFPLAHGIPNRVGRLRGYGNAINPQVAAEFIAAYLQETNQ